MSFYRTFTLLHTDVPSDQTDFPVTMVGTFAYLATVANGGKVQNANGYDIYFSSDAGGSSVLKFERVSWNATTGACEFWIKIPTLSHSADTVIYLQYGNSTITTDQQDAANTWDGNYVGVYHFGSSSSLAVTDSKNLNNGTNHSVTAGTGPLGAPQGAGNFVAASSQYIDLGSNTSIEIAGSITIEAWFKATGSGGTFQLIVSNYDAGPTNGYGLIFHNGTDVYIQLYNATTTQTANGRTVTQTNWQQYVATYDGTTVKIYTDATNDASSSTGLGIGTSLANANIGRWPGGATDYLDGLVDEVRISKIARSADYITTSYNAFNDYVNFVTIGTEQVGATPVNEVITDTLSLSDSELIQLTDAFVFADSQAGNWGDAISFNLTIPGIGLSDDFSGTWGDSVLLLMPFDISSNDTLALTDGPNQPAKNMNAFIDTMALSDSQSIIVAITIGFTDSFTWTDSTNVIASLLVTQSDTFTWSDAFSFNVPFNRTISDFFIWRDGQTIAWSSILPALTDSFSWSDTVVVDLEPFWTPVNEVLTDTLSLSDSLLYNLAINIGISDTFSPSDFVAVINSFNPFNQSFQDSFNWSDGILIIVEGELLQFADQFNLSDSVLVQNATTFNSYIRRYLNDEPA